jgi:hypothetical protein
MENERRVPTASVVDEALDAYEAPKIEDLDGTFGPTVTAAGQGGSLAPPP